MVEYYGYAERQNDDYIDWAKVSADVTKKLDDEKDRRVNKKAELDEAQRQAMNVFETPNIGDNKTLNEVYLNNAEQAKQQQLIWHKELTSGRMTPAEYSRLTQNLLDDNKVFTGVVNQAQDAFARTKERIDKGIASEIEIAQMEKIQEFTDLNNTAFRVDPKSGKMIVVKKNPDGTISDNPNDILSIQKIFSNLGVTIDRFMLEEEVNKDVKFLAKEYQKVIGTGRIQTLDDLRQNPEFQKAIDDAVKAKLVSPNNTASILAEFGQYKISSDVRDQGKEGIIFVDYSKNIPEAVLTTSQKEEAAKIVRSQYEVQIGKKETYRAPVSSGGGGDGGKKLEDMDLLSTLAKMYYGGTTAEIDVAAGLLRDYMNGYVKQFQEDNVIKITRDNEGFTMRTDSGIDVPFDFKGKSLDQFLEGSRLKVGVKDGNIARRVARELQKNGRLTIGNINDYVQNPITTPADRKKQEAEESYIPYSFGNIGKKSKTAVDSFGNPI
jgi:hypothetical protein